MKSRQQLDSHFSQLKQQLTAALDTRRRELEEEVQEIEEDAMEPLAQSEEIIRKGVRDAKMVMDEGEEQWCLIRCAIQRCQCIQFYL